jgi:hypothetical protein
LTAPPATVQKTICVTELAIDFGLTLPEKQLHHNRSLSLASGSMLEEQMHHNRSLSLPSGSMLEERMHHNRSLSLASGSMLQEQMHNNKGRVVAPVMSNCIGLICLMCFRLQATEQQSSE